MATTVALLRGVNIGGRQIAMSDLRELFAHAGCEDVRSYIQSGNLVFSLRRPPDRRLAADLERRITEATGHDVGVVLRTSRELAAVLADNPFPPSVAAHVHVTFLPDAPDPSSIRALEALEAGREQLAGGRHEVYLYLPDGSGRAKLPQQVLRLDRRATIRNLRTVTKLAEMASS